jgi:hypothetical protein
MKRKPAATPAEPQPRYTLGPDIDLDVEEITEPDGSRLTEPRAQIIAEEALSEIRRGRPALGHEPRKAGRSPQITVRVTATTREKAVKRARSEGRTLSELARIALECYLAGHREHD